MRSGRHDSIKKKTDAAQALMLAGGVVIKYASRGERVLMSRSAKWLGRGAGGKICQLGLGGGSTISGLDGVGM